MVILDLWGISFHPAVVVGLGNDLLFNSILAHCANIPPGRSRLYLIWYNETRLKRSVNFKRNFLMSSNLPKEQRNFFKDFALACNKRSDQKNKGTPTPWLMLLWLWARKTEGP
jgi:hypothetical protein